MKKLLHILLLLLIAAAVFAVPYRAFIGPIRLPGSGVDAVTSPSVILDAPSGSYVVLLNEGRHQKYDSADDWAAFFSGESLVIMDDVVCEAMTADPGGIDMAMSYRSRLPENQMEVRLSGMMMLISRAQAGRFDAIVMTKEMADSCKASTVYDVPGVRVIEVSAA